jgi:PilZ domain
VEDKTATKKVHDPAEPIPGNPHSGRRQRAEQREPVDTSAVLRLIDIAADVHGRILDVSIGGCRIRTDKRFPVGIFRRVEAEFRFEGLPFRLGGVTQALYDPFSVGIRFLDMSDRKREQLMQLIEEIRIQREKESATTAQEMETLPSGVGEAGREPG